jgi:hypothetical protein
MSVKRKKPLSGLPDGSSEFFYLDDNHNKQDADLHQPILDGGDHEAARAVSRAVMKRLGFPDDKIDGLLKGEK